MVRLPQQQREQRILDVAVELFLRHGYDKTTIAEIARAAGIGKGSVYLHFRNKEELLDMLFLRELHAYSEAWFAAVMAAPQGGTLGGMYKAMIQALDGSRFITAVLRRDGTVLGAHLMRRPDSILQASARGQMTRHEVIALMQQAGAVRDDIDAKVIAHMIDMLAQGMVQLEMSPSDGPGEAVTGKTSLGPVIEGIGEIMDRALTPAHAGASEAGKAVLQQVFEAGRQSLQALLAERSRRQREDTR
ncbi:MAG: helix-turn-helix domain-containing protein [Myxococcota bacterium]